MSFFNELKRRNVFRVSIGYVITAWLLLQVVDLVLENVNAPDWVMQVFMLALAIGFPLVLFFAWAFEMTPEGVKRESQVDRSQSIAPQTGRKMDRNIIIALTLALAYFAYDKFLASPADDLPDVTVAEQHLQQESASTDTLVPAEDAITQAGAPPSALNPDEKSVAVLPFVNMSDDAQNEYFSDGISEELLNVLVKVQGLRVPSRTSSFTFKGSSKKLAEIGEELQVDHILEGSVRKSGNRIRVTAQLIEVDTDTHLWSDTYTRELDDIFAVQDEIAKAIVSALKITLTGKDQSMIQTRSTANVEAYNKYLLGRHLWNQRSSASILASAKPLLEAVKMDPEFGRAWEALADAYTLIPEYSSGPIKEYIPLAHDAINKALAINPESAPALTTAAYIKFMYDYDFETARTEFIKAIEIDPAYATAHQWYGELLATQGDFNAALDELRTARQLDPLAPVMPHVMGWILMFTDRLDESHQYFLEAVELNPDMQAANGSLARLYMLDGQFDLARQYARKSTTTNKIDPTTELAVIDAFENPALKDRAVALVLADTNYPDGTFSKAEVLMTLGEPELALDSLEKGFENGDPYAVHMKRMNIYDPLRANPRFQALLKKMNMWP